MSGFDNIAAIKQRNKDTGYHFFDKDTLKFFNSRVLPTVYHGHYFITSELKWGDTARRYTARHCDDAGNVTTIGRFYEHASKSGARYEIKLHFTKLNPEDL